MAAQTRLYFDCNASAPLLPAARQAMLEALDLAGNASSVHGEGRALRGAIEQARRTLAGCLGTDPANVVFTSGASEAAALALSPAMSGNGSARTVSKLFVSAVEHPCVLSGGRFAPGQIEILPVDGNGIVDLAQLEARLGAHDRDTGPAMVAVMLANNETGVIQPVNEVARVARAHDALVLVDAVQGLGKLDLDLSRLDADFVLLSAHKLGGPHGAGALVLGSADLKPAPLVTGGAQENRLRAGTENVAAIAGFAAAARQVCENASMRAEMGALRDYIEDGLRAMNIDTVVFGGEVERLPNTVCFAVPGVKAQTALIALDLAGIAVSSGSACSSGKVGKSHVLAAMGVDDELAAGAIRISLGPQNDKAEAGRFLSAWREISDRGRASSGEPAVALAS